MSTLKAYNIDSGDTTNLAIKTNGTTALTINGSTQAVTAASTIADSTAVLRPLVSGTSQNSTSGTSIDFTGIPSWVRRITVMFSGVSTSGTSNLQIQLGTSSGIDNTASSYLGTESTSVGATSAAHSTGFVIKSGIAATSVLHGSVSLQLLSASANTWVESGSIGTSNTTQVGVSGGSKSLSGTLDRIRVTTVNGTDTFDAGSINILYE